MSRVLKIITVIFFFVLTTPLYANQDAQPAITSPIPIDQLEGYSSYPPIVKELIHEAWYLSTKNLTYQFGSADPNNKGMDCSGTMYYLLKNAKISEVPRDSNGMFEWVKKSGKFHTVKSNDFSSDEFSELKPGDLLFWSGTYHNNGGISHVMLYLGKNKNGQPLMFGSSDGRTYQGKKMWGVSVFDLELPNGKTAAKFEGYSCIPTLTCKHVKETT